MTNLTALVGPLLGAVPSQLSPLLNTPWAIIAAASATPAQIASAVALIDAPISMFQDAKATKIYQYGWTGYPESDLPKIPADVTVCNCHQSSTPIAEYVMAAILNWNVKLVEQDQRMRNSCWTSAPPGNTCQQSRHVLRQTKNLTLGILGYGHIGKAIAQRASAFGMRIIATDKRAQIPPPTPLAWLGSDADNWRLVEESDFIVVALPLLNSTRGLVNAALLSHARNTSVLINIARGPIVEEEALYDALSTGTLAGAVIDVWWHSLHSIIPATFGPDSWPSAYRFDLLHNVIMTPHDSGESAEAEQEALREIAANLDNFALGKPLQNVVRPASIEN
eukprot:CAMPEP_0119320998 /NCGR_PEP_ID=MMETSP1333-20130426/54124_1 /TAXON_ID=418940 /ORGANISM="Scyphosphaera apsteinii, Strain RCC1455" /LENGTH=335 /DNA_ID=CAMNT_0007327853 /DNA_START=101 /DNA_END=1108 /DNA_ORIENTATION=-